MRAKSIAILLLSLLAFAAPGWALDGRGGSSGGSSGVCTLAAPTAGTCSNQAGICAKCNLTSAQLLIMNSSPVTVVAAPGAGKIYEVTSMSFDFLTGTRGYDNQANPWVFLQYANESIAVGGDNSLGTVNLGNVAHSFFASGPGGLTVHVIPNIFTSHPVSTGADNQALQLVENFNMNTFGGIGTNTLNAGGTGYVNGDTGTFTDGDSDATYTVTGVDGGGAVTTYTVTGIGTGYQVGTDSPTATGGSQPGVGTGFTVDIATILPGNGTMVFTVYYRTDTL